MLRRASDNPKRRRSRADYARIERYAEGRLYRATVDGDGHAAAWWSNVVLHAWAHARGPLA